MQATDVTGDSTYNVLITVLYILFEFFNISIGCAAVIVLMRSSHRSHNIVWLIIVFGIIQEIATIIMDAILYAEEYPDSELKCKTVSKLSNITIVVIVYFITFSSVKRRFTVNILKGFLSDAYALGCIWYALGLRTMNCFFGDYEPGSYWTPLHVSLYCPLDLSLCHSFVKTEYLFIYIPALMIHLYLRLTRKSGKFWELRIVNSYHDETAVPCSRCEKHNRDLQRVLMVILVLAFAIRPIVLIQAYTTRNSYYEILSSALSYGIYLYICMKTLGTRRFYRRIKL